MKKWLAASDLAGLPGLPTTSRGISKAADRDEWLSRPRNGRGGGREYHFSSLPQQVRETLLARTLETPVERPANETLSPDTSSLADWQRAAMNARAGLLAEVDRLTMTGATATAAIETLVKLARHDGLPPALVDLVVDANARSGKKQGGGKRTLSRSTLCEWLKIRDFQGVAALAPKAPETAQIPAWAPALMEVYCLPSKPSLAWALEKLPERLHEGVAVPSYDTARRFLKRLSAVTRNKGRMGPRALKSMKAYVARDVSNLWPTAVYSADGHTFDAEVSHPIHGRPFRPEITSVIDIFSRRITGWSAALSESTWSVLDAARNAFETSGLCDVWYIDRGKGFNNAAFDAELTGFLGRLAVTKQNSLPYNSQARGVIERVHQSTWVREARGLPTFVGASMDGEARQKTFNITRKVIAESGRSRLLMAWDDFINWCEAQVAAYNARPHSSLPRISDPESGRRRHMSPDEAWQQAMTEGWRPDVLDEAEARDLFRPYERRKTSRALVTLFNNSYFHPDLEAWHGEEVLVGYDIHDASRVWVRDLKHRLICVAEFEGNKRDYFPVSAVEAAHERRIEGRLRRLETHREEIEAERGNGKLVELPAEPPFSDSDLEIAGAALDSLAAPDPEPATPSGGRPIFGNDVDWVLWLAAEPDRMTAEDGRLLRERSRNSTFRMLLEMEGVAATTLDRLIDTAKRKSTEAA